MDLGVAGSINTKLLGCSVFNRNLDTLINEWLEKNPDIEVIEIQYAVASDSESFYTSALIIYRDEEVIT